MTCYLLIPYLMTFLCLITLSRIFDWYLFWQRPAHKDNPKLFKGILMTNNLLRWRLCDIMNRERRWTQFKVVSWRKCGLLPINQLYDNQIIGLCVSRCQRRFQGTFLMSATSNFVDSRSVKTRARVSFLLPWSLSLLWRISLWKHNEQTRR